MEPTPQNPYSNNWNSPLPQGKELPNSQTSMILGIISLVCAFVLGCCYGIGVFPALILSIIGLVMGNKAIKAYNNEPGVYSEKSLKNAKAGKIMSIIALVFSAICVLFLIIVIAFGMMSELERMNRFN